MFQSPVMSADTVPTSIDLSQLGEPVYNGSVQRLFAAPGHPGFMVCETTPAGSVFDVGSIFDIKDNDLNRAVFRHALYSQLGKAATWQTVKQRIEADTSIDPAWKAELLKGPLETMVASGGMSHHVGMIDSKTGAVVTEGMPENPSCYNVVRRFPVMKPPQRPFIGGHVFDYEQFYQSSTYVVPLEYIVRFGITGGSSILRKHAALNDSAKRAYEQELGLTQPMEAWQMLSHPIYDLTSKYEPEDRNVSRQEALLMSGLATQGFLDTVKMALLGGWVIRSILDDIGLTLWDMKWEFAVDGDDCFFVDTVDTDSFRATSTLDYEDRKLILHYNKQAMRDYYKIVHAAWYAGVNEAKNEAAKQGRPFTGILREGQASGRWLNTPVVDAEFLDLQAEKTLLIREHMLGQRTDAREKLQACGFNEIAFYAKRGLVTQYAALNALA
ncbi:MAG: Phosphoribosylaminoimidazole-succinocarboxamide synthase [Verrucomicrobiaceae bacterium]|nr:Phosphoribosylaminoimidazole-succinocarboxamide synthase [Verrucomicrobiaceae bacterium]